MSDYKEVFKLLLENTFVSGKGSEEDIHKNMTEFLGKVIDNMPEKLFRFRKIDEQGNALNSFENGMISLCRPSCFSDKYDSIVFVDVEKQLEINEDALKRGMRHVLESIKRRDPMIRANKAARVCYMLEQGMGEQEIIDTIVSENYADFVEEVKRELTQRQSRVRDCVDTARIACFTEDVQSKYMWDRYADGYRGFALEYNLRDFFIKCYMKSISAYVFPVIYTDEKPDLTREEVNEYCLSMMKEKEWASKMKWLIPFLDSNLLSPHKYFLYKDKEAYAHEKEWRILYYDLENKADYIELPDEGCLKAIYYGIDTSKEDLDRLHKIAINKGIKEYRVAIDNKSRKYRLTILPF